MTNKKNVMWMLCNVVEWLNCSYTRSSQKWVFTQAVMLPAEVFLFYLGPGNIFVHWVFGFEDFLNLLLRTDNTDKTREGCYCRWNRQKKKRNMLLQNFFFCTTKPAICSTRPILTLFSWFLYFLYKLKTQQMQHLASAKKTKQNKKCA